MSEMCSKTHECVIIDISIDLIGECLLISSLPGKALRTLVDMARLAERFNIGSQS